MKAQSRLFRFFSIIIVVIVSAACDDGRTEKEAVSLYVPDFLLETRAVDQENLYPKLVVDNSEVSLNRNGNTWTTTYYVTPNDDYTISIRWYETYRGRELQLASATKSIRVASEGVAVGFSTAEYNTNFDVDNDGDSNLIERESDTNPFVHRQHESSVDVIIPRLPEGKTAPQIDGEFNAEEWAYATQKDVSGTTLFIQKLLFEEDTGADIAEPVSRWRALHDGVYLYLLVFSDDQTQTSDSSYVWDDDNLNIYTDGDYSHARGYDGANDYHFMIPLLKLNSGNANQSGSNGRLQQGGHSATLPADTKFACGIGTGPSGTRFARMDVYEVKISLAGLDIDIGSQFGLEIHLDDDDSGGERDSKWSWFSSGGDFAYRFTDVFAAAILEK